ncbi:MAG: protein-L-isoaspartate O-methyltransferase, partial [Mesorhizobium sp.]
ILVSVAADRTPPALLDQLKPGGRLVLPLVAEDVQFLTVIDKAAAGQIKTRKLIPVRFSRLETV